MGEIHNLQIVITLSTLLHQMHQGLVHGAANGAQILNVVEQDKSVRKLSTVRELSELEKTEKEDPKKRRIKKSASGHLIDIYK
ncbi:MAG: hypothetical protein GY866_26015 [Proteobacteria bacterium]|nr:hypothetical protein [Pseudomonadota bacterium]